MDSMTMAAFVRQHSITMTAERTDSNPGMADSHDMDHWKVTLRRKTGRPVAGSGKQMTTYFSMGYGHNGKQPKAAEVLSCLASDAAGADNARSFEDFCAEFGYDTDSRKAEKIYTACEQTAKRLRQFLGDAYEPLLYHTERE